MSVPTLTIREAADTDIPVMARIMSAVNPNHPWTPESLAHELQTLRNHPLELHLAEWLAEEDGQPVGVASTTQFIGMYHPDRYWAEVMVLPDCAGRGVGAGLARVLEAHLRSLGAREVLAGAYEDQPRALAFLQRRGFTEAMRYFDNVLDVSTFDPAPWAAHEALPGNLRALSLAALEAEMGQEAARRAFHSAFSEARLDVPRTGEASEITFEDFQTRLSHPLVYPGGILLAVTDSGEVVALSELEHAEGDPGRLNTGLTGTRRAWRRKGLALALKLRAIRLAQERGVRQIWTGNASTNAPMLAINERLGFRPRPAYVEMKWGGV